jgi:ssDNA-binding Zn-finger/Zn-ribbon topoisomerase 1
VGAIYDFGDESLVAMDTYHWRGNGDQIRLPRLETELGVSHFLMAPVERERFSPYTKKVPFQRFPQWLFCPSCRLMIWLDKSCEKTGEHPRCEQCAKRSKLVPMRFVTACKGGHLGEVPWRRWAHSTATEHSQRQCQVVRLKFETRRSGGGGLGSLWVVCQECGAGRSLHGIARKDSLRGIISSCDNRQPWERPDPPGRQQCGEFPQVLQRGATNLYFPKVPSAIDIPDSSQNAPNLVVENVKAHDFYKILKSMYGATTDPAANPAVAMAAKMIADALKCDPEEVVGVLRADLNPQPAARPKGMDGLLREEWDAFMGVEMAGDPGAPFVAERADLAPVLDGIGDKHPFRSLVTCIDRVVLARRIREVRALQGFERYEPGSTMLRPDLDRTLGWLPGIEVFGEGVFLALRQQAISDWEDAFSAPLAARIGAMQDRRRRSNLAFLPTCTPRFVLLHTLAHMLMRQLSFECGYASSSLRERIFASEASGDLPGMAGILIYTAEGDSEGSLGGLVREGQPERLFPTLLTALQNARWCSGDPICRELAAQGLQGLNRAACHACALVSETSCICANVLLDRAVLVGDDAGLPGFFGDVCAALQQSLSGVQTQ